MTTRTTPLIRRRTKIVATIGPASREPDVLAELLRAGVNVFRLNLSHGSHDDHRENVRRIRAAASAHRARPSRRWASSPSAASPAACAGALTLQGGWTVRSAAVLPDSRLVLPEMSRIRTSATPSTYPPRTGRTVPAAALGGEMLAAPGRCKQRPSKARTLTS